MVDFDLTEEQLLMREMAHDFAEKEIRPRAWEYDRDGTWPEDILEKAREVGLVNSHVPSEYGGSGASYLEGSVIVEELAWGCAAIATTLGAHRVLEGARAVRRADRDAPGDPVHDRRHGDRHRGRPAAGK